MDVREFDFHLPAELIAQEPAADRGAGRLLVLRRDTGRVDHRSIVDLPELLRDGDVLVVNDTRVFPARLMGRRVPSGGAVECLLIGRLADGPDAAAAKSSASEQQWEALMHPGQRLGPGANVVFEGPPTIHGEILERRFHGRRVIRLWTADGSPIDDAVDTVGHVPAAAVHQAARSDRRSRSVPDHLCAAARVHRRTHGRSSHQPRADGGARPARRRHRRDHAPRRLRHVPAGACRTRRRSSARARALRRRPDGGGAHQSRARRGPPRRRGRHDDDACAGGRGAGATAAVLRLEPGRPTSSSIRGSTFGSSAG